METHSFLIQLVLILFTSRLVGELAARIQIPSVIGELVAGIILGPTLFNFVDITPPIQLLAEIGIIMLLFEVGLDTDLSRLIKAGVKACVVAFSGVILPLVLGFCLSYYLFHFSLLASLFIGSTLTATSIGITLRVLSDLKKQRTSEAQVILGAAVIDDIIGIVILSLLFEFSASGDVNLWHAGKIMLFIALFLVIAPIAVKTISVIIKKCEEKSDIPGLLTSSIISLILFFSWIANQLGAPELLGGFAAGLALSKDFRLPFIKSDTNFHDFSDRIHHQMLPIIHLFTPIFFVSIGLSLNLKEIALNSSYIWILTSSILAVAIFSKFISGFLLFKESRFSKIIIGTAMIPRGEVGLIFAGIGLSSQVFDNDVYASLILVIAATTLFAPFALRLLYKAEQPTQSK